MTHVLGKRSGRTDAYKFQLGIRMWFWRIAVTEACGAAPLQECQENTSKVQYLLSTTWWKHAVGGRLRKLPQVLQAVFDRSRTKLKELNNSGWGKWDHTPDIKKMNQFSCTHSMECWLYCTKKCVTNIVVASQQSGFDAEIAWICLLYTSPSPRD